MAQTRIYRAYTHLHQIKDSCTRQAILMDTALRNEYWTEYWTIERCSNCNGLIISEDQKKFLNDHPFLGKRSWDMMMEEPREFSDLFDIIRCTGTCHNEQDKYNQCFVPDELVPHDNRCLQCIVDSEPECLHDDDTYDDDLEFKCLECKVGQTDGKTQICKDCVDDLWDTNYKIHKNTEAILHEVHACDHDAELEEMHKCACGKEKSPESQICKECIRNYNDRTFRIIQS